MSENAALWRLRVRLLGQLCERTAGGVIALSRTEMVKTLEMEHDATCADTVTELMKLGMLAKADGNDTLLVKVPRPEREGMSPPERVFAHWQTVMQAPKARLDGVRLRVIAARLRDGFTVADLCQAIDGCAKTAWNMGDNPSGAKYNDVALIFRDAGHTERFMDAAGAKEPTDLLSAVRSRMGY